MDQKTRRRLYNQCKPNEPLHPEDPRNVDVDRAGTIDTRVRGVNWVDRLAAQVEFADEPQFALFTGLPGSGKSTELFRLVNRLRDEKGLHALVALVNAEDVLDLTSPIDVPDVLTALLVEAEREVIRAEGGDVAEASGDGYLARLWGWLSKTDLELTRSEFKVSDVGKLIVEMKTRPSLRQRVRETVAAHLTTFLADVREAFLALDHRARARGRSGLVVVLDTLEKLSGISTNWERVIDSAEKVLAGGALREGLPVHALLTVPPALVLRRRFEGVLFMPMIKLRDREGRRVQEGYDVCRAIVERRVDRAALAELFGSAAEARVERLIEWSGGYPRELVRLLRAVLAIGEDPLSQSSFDRLLQEAADSYRRVVPDYAFDWLASVAVHRRLKLESEAQRLTVDMMLTGNIVLRYLNHAEWFDLHPAVRDIPGVEAAIRRLGSA